MTALKESRPRRRRIVLTLGLLCLVLPAALLAGLYLASERFEFSYGNVIFVLTGVVGVAWMVFAGYGRRMGAASPWNELVTGAGTQYVKDRAEGPLRQLRSPLRLMVVLTATCVLGWVGLVWSVFA